jgi:hypothetical protein
MLYEVVLRYEEPMFVQEQDDRRRLGECIEWKGHVSGPTPAAAIIEALNQMSEHNKNPDDCTYIAATRVGA